jgi:hypothetical protein
MLRLGSSTGTKRSPEAEGEDDGQEAASAGMSAHHPSLCYIIRHIRRVVWVTGRAGCAGMSAGNKVTVPFSILFTELQIVMRFYEMNMKWPQVSKPRGNRLRNRARNAYILCNIMHCMENFSGFVLLFLNVALRCLSSCSTSSPCWAPSSKWTLCRCP